MASKARTYIIYKVDQRNGDKKRLADVYGNTRAQAWKNFKMEYGWKYKSLKGMFSIIPYNMESKYRSYKSGK